MEAVVPQRVGCTETTCNAQTAVCLNCDFKKVMMRLIREPTLFQTCRDIGAVMAKINEIMTAILGNNRWGALFLTYAQIEYYASLVSLCNYMYTPYKNLDLSKLDNPEYLVHAVRIMATPQ